MAVGCSEIVEEHERPCPRSVRHEDFVLDAGAPAAQLEALRGITEVVGDVQINGVDSLEPLACLVRVEGALSLDVASLEGLEKLERVGALYLSGSLRSADPLERLTTVDGDVSLFKLPAADNLQFAIEDVGGSVTINEVNPEATFDVRVDATFAGSIVTIQTAPDMRQFTRRLEHVAGDIDLGGTGPAQVDLTGLRSVGGSLIISAYPDALPMPDLGALAEVGNDLVLTNVLAEDLSSLASLQRAGGLELQAFPNLRTLDGLDQLRVLEHAGPRVEYWTSGLSLIGHPVLEDISALGGIERVVAPPNGSPLTTSISGCDRLSNLHGVEPTLAWVEKMTLIELPALQDFTSLVPGTSVPGLHVEATGLTSLAGVDPAGPWFQRGDGVDLWLLDNLDLVELMPAAATTDSEVVDSGFLIIEGNTSLGQCEAEAFVAAATTRGFRGSSSIRDLIDDTPCDS